MTAARRRALRQLLTDTLPWIVNVRVGPTTVDAGACGACGLHPALVAVCGPVTFQAVCAPCCLHPPAELFCAGHADAYAYAKAYCASLPANWASCVLLWWVATGELQLAGLSDLDAVIAKPGAQRVDVDELVRRNAQLLRTRDVFLTVIDE